MVMVLIVPIEEAAAERLGVLDAAEALRKLRLVFHGFEVALRERIVIGGVRPAVGFGDAEIGEQECRGLGSHRTAAVGMESKLAFRRGMFGGGVLEQCGEQGGALPVGDTPADDAPAENVDDDVEIEVGPFGWSHQLGDIPGPDLVGRQRQQLRLFIDWMPQLLAPLPDFLAGGQDAVHGADRAVVDPFVEQAGVDLGWRLIGEARCVQKIQHDLAFDGSQSATRLQSGATHGLWPRQMPAMTIDAGARQVQCRARTGGETGRRRQRDDGSDHDASSLSDVASGRPSKAATFFWMAMMASACSSRRTSRAFSRLACASSAVNGLRGAGFGPRLIGVSPPRAPAARNPRQSLRVEEYRPSRRRMTAVPPAGARSISASIRNLSPTVNVRRRGRSDSSGAPAAPSNFTSLIGITM